MYINWPQFSLPHPFSFNLYLYHLAAICMDISNSRLKFKKKVTNLIFYLVCTLIRNRCAWISCSVNKKKQVGYTTDRAKIFHNSVPRHSTSFTVWTTNDQIKHSWYIQAFMLYGWLCNWKDHVYLNASLDSASLSYVQNVKVILDAEQVLFHWNAVLNRIYCFWSFIDLNYLERTASQVFKKMFLYF